MRLTSHVATAHPAPVKNPTQAQTTISSRLTFVGIEFPLFNVVLRATAISTGFDRPGVKRCDVRFAPALAKLSMSHGDFYFARE
jgi:hypothetical protein